MVKHEKSIVTPLSQNIMDWQCSFLKSIPFEVQSLLFNYLNIFILAVLLFSAAFVF